MKLKTLFAFTSLLCATAASAQDAPAEQTTSNKTSSVRAKFGPEAGITFTNYKVKIPAFDAAGSMDRKLGFRGGFVIDVSINGHYHIQPGASIVTMGGSDSDDSTKTVVNLVYAQVPLNFIYTLKENHGLFFGAGLYYGYAITGNNKETDKKRDETEKTSVTFGETGEWKRGDFGANILAGYQFHSGFYVKGYYSPGIANVSATPIAEARHSAFGISIGYIPN